MIPLPSGGLLAYLFIYLSIIFISHLLFIKRGAQGLCLWATEGEGTGLYANCVASQQRLIGPCVIQFAGLTKRIPGAIQEGCPYVLMTGSSSPISY